MATATKKPRKRAKQTLIKEVEELRHPKLDAMFEDRAEHTAELSSLRSKVGEINEEIREYMEEHNLKEYRHDDYKAEFEEGEPTLKISKIKEPKPEPAK